MEAVCQTATRGASDWEAITVSEPANTTYLLNARTGMLYPTRTAAQALGGNRCALGVGIGRS